MITFVDACAQHFIIPHFKSHFFPFPPPSLHLQEVFFLNSEFLAKDEIKTQSSSPDVGQLLKDTILIRLSPKTFLHWTMLICATLQATLPELWLAMNQ